jgi:hypothetical protein
MSNKFSKIGAVFYLLWGLLHVLGGFLMLSASSVDLGSYLQVLMGEQSALADVTTNNAVATSATLQVFAYHAFNLTWLGVLVSVIAIVSNWKNQASGFWVNLALVGLIDLGLIVYMVVPGVIPRSDPWWLGPVLYVFAVIFSAVGLRQSK